MRWLFRESISSAPPFACSCFCSVRLVVAVRESRQGLQFCTTIIKFWYDKGLIPASLWAWTVKETNLLDNLCETMLMCARCANAYHCKMPAQLPSSDGSDACPEDGVRASNTKIITWSSFLQSHNNAVRLPLGFRRSAEREWDLVGKA